jgi:hypothetical protein
LRLGRQVDGGLDVVAGLEGLHDLGRRPPRNSAADACLRPFLHVGIVGVEFRRIRLRADIADAHVAAGGTDGERGERKAEEAGREGTTVRHQSSFERAQSAGMNAGPR